MKTILTILSLAALVSVASAVDTKKPSQFATDADVTEGVATRKMLSPATMANKLKLYQTTNANLALWSTVSTSAYSGPVKFSVTNLHAGTLVTNAQNVVVGTNLPQIGYVFSATNQPVNAPWNTNANQVFYGTNVTGFNAATLQGAGTNH